jgi:hypothetical protein
MLFILCTASFRVWRFMYIYYTWETLLIMFLRTFGRRRPPTGGERPDKGVPGASGRTIECARRGTGGMGPPLGDISTWMKRILARGVHTSARRVWRSQGGGPSRGLWAEGGWNVGSGAEQSSSLFLLSLLTSFQIPISSIQIKFKFLFWISDSQSQT